MRTINSCVKIKNSEEIEQTLLNGMGQRVGLCISSKHKTVDMIVSETKLTALQVKLVLGKFLSLGIVDTFEKTNACGIVDRFYKLIQSHVEFVYSSDSLDLPATINLLSREMTSILCSIVNSVGAGYLKLNTIKANEKDVQEFVEELDQLVKKFERIEDDASSDTYSFISIVGIS